MLALLLRTTTRQLPICRKIGKVRPNHMEGYRVYQDPRRKQLEIVRGACELSLATVRSLRNSCKMAYVNLTKAIYYLCFWQEKQRRRSL